MAVCWLYVCVSMSCQCLFWNVCGPFLCRNDGLEVDSACCSTSQPVSQSVCACVLSCSCLWINPSVTKGTQAFLTYPAHQLSLRSKNSFESSSQTLINYVLRVRKEIYYCFFPDDSLTFADPLEKFVPVATVLLPCLKSLSRCLLAAPSVLLFFLIYFLHSILIKTGEFVVV